MQIEILVLGKNFYDMEGQRGANLVVFGEFEETNNKKGISISETPIDFEQHHLVDTFPAIYKGEMALISAKNRSGKNVTTIKIANPVLLYEVDFLKKNLAKQDVKS